MDARVGIKSPDTTAVGVSGLDVPPERRWIKISPLNRRRWQSFKANRRGYWSLWIFLALFFISLFAEFIANDKPIYIHVNGRTFFPAVATYPDTAFAKAPDPNLFGTAADYRDPYLIDLIKKEGGTVVWPPVRFSYGTQVSKPPSPFPSKPTWLLNQKDCEFRRQPRLRQMRRPRIQLARHRRRRARRPGAADLRFPHLGAVRSVPDHCLLDHRRRRRRGAGLFRRLDRSAVPALHRDLDLDSLALSAADYLVGAGAGLLCAARNSCCCSPGCRWWGWCGRSFCAGAISNTSWPRARSACRTAPSFSGICCPTPWWRP